MPQINIREEFYILLICDIWLKPFLCSVHDYCVNKGRVNCKKYSSLLLTLLAIETSTIIHLVFWGGCLVFVEGLMGEGKENIHLTFVPWDIKWGMRSPVLHSSRSLWLKFFLKKRASFEKFHNKMLHIPYGEPSISSK